MKREKRGPGKRRDESSPTLEARRNEETTDDDR